MTADDSDECLATLLVFLTLRPGDTDADYFDGYTERQRDWTQDYACESLACDVSCFEEDARDDDETDPPWVDVVDD